MRGWERWLVAVVGGGLGGAGVFAVLTTENSLGSATLVIVGAALLLIGVQGTRLVRFGDGPASVELAQYQAVATLSRRAEHEEDPDVADGLAEAASIIRPDLVESPRALSGSYEVALRDALNYLDLETQRESYVGPFRADFVVRLADGRRLMIEVKYQAYGTLGISTVDQAIAQLERLARIDEQLPGLLIVTNAPLSGAVQEFNANRGSDRVEVITWNGPSDNDLLMRAVSRLAR